MEVKELYSLEKIKQIAQGDKQFLRRMINLFLEQTPVTVREMREAHDARDFSTMAMLAHRLKSVLDTMDIQSLREDIRRLEKMDHESPVTAEANALITRVETVIAAVVARMHTT